MAFLSNDQEGGLSPPHASSNRRRRTRRRRSRSNSTSSSESSYQNNSNSNNNHSSGPKKTKWFVSLAEQQQYIAMDCEMVGVGAGGCQSSLARVTCVDWNGTVLYDQLVQPTEPVTDYRTFVSNITAADLESATAVPFAACRTAVSELLKGKTLIGHALKNDLHALQLQHPWQYTRDTAKYEPFMKQRFEDGVWWPRKLKDLVWEHLQQNIQPHGQPHSAYQDAMAALQLYQSVRPKWEKIMTYKIQKTALILEQQQQLCCTPSPPLQKQLHPPTVGTTTTVIPPSHGTASRPIALAA